jgi:hypothetical protein
MYLDNDFGKTYNNKVSCKKKRKLNGHKKIFINVDRWIHCDWFAFGKSIRFISKLRD